MSKRAFITNAFQLVWTWLVVSFFIWFFGFSTEESLYYKTVEIIVFSIFRVFTYWPYLLGAVVLLPVLGFVLEWLKKQFRETAIQQFNFPDFVVASILFALAPGRKLLDGDIANIINMGNQAGGAYDEETIRDRAKYRKQLSPIFTNEFIGRLVEDGQFDPGADSEWLLKGIVIVVSAKGWISVEEDLRLTELAEILGAIPILLAIPEYREGLDKAGLL